MVTHFHVLENQHPNAPAARHSLTGHRPPISGLASIGSISVRYQLKYSAPLERNVNGTSLVENAYSKIPIAILQSSSFGVFAYLAKDLTAIAIVFWFASHIKHPISSRRSQSPLGLLG